MPDLELQPLERSVHLADYARSAGYQPSARDSTPSVTVLDHPQTLDRVAVARTPDGQWIFASLPDYNPPRTGGDPADLTRERLRDCIARTHDKGSVVEFVQHCERVAGRPEPSVDQVREHLRSWLERQRPLDRDGRSPAASPQERAQAPAQERVQTWLDDQRAPIAAFRSAPSSGPEEAAQTLPANIPLDRRIGDWTASPASPAPSEAEVQERLRRWQQAQHTIDQRLAPASDVANSHAAPALASPAIARGAEPPRSPRDASRDRGGSLAQAQTPAQRQLGQRRYDAWTPPAPELPKPLARTVRGPDRGR